MTPQEMRNERLKNDHLEMCNLRGDIVSWKIVRGNAPFVEEYEMTVNVRTVIGAQPSYRNSHCVRVVLPNGYPTARPQIMMKTTPPPFHPNWFVNGTWCPGKGPDESLGQHIIRMIRTLQYDLEITNETSAANDDANKWYIRNRSRGLFPCDNKTLPDPTHRKGTFAIKCAGTKVFNIH